MAEARAASIAHMRINSTITEFFAGLIGFLFILMLAALSIYVQRPPAPVPANAPGTEFSSTRAMQHLNVIARKPHPVGSAEHAQVRDYLVSQLNALGLHPEVQNATSVDQRGVPYRAATVDNIVARLGGTANSKALMLVGHYDSMPTAPGASDDGSAVVAILETLRALKEGAPLKNDLIVLFSDAEEVGLLGAKAFMDEHPWAKDVGLVLNFEARGNGGPATMFETSGGNGRMIKEFARAAPYPTANSLSYEIYKLLPNDTDLTIFKNDGLAGLNFAFIQGVAHYHTSADNLEAIDERSLQHQGTYALALTRHFGNLDLAEAGSKNAVYFNLFGFTLIHYSSVWILPLMILVTLIFVGVTLLGFKRHLLTLSGMALGFLAFLISTLCSALVVSSVWWLIRRLHPGYRAIIQGDTYNSGVYMVSLVALSIALTAGLYLFFRKRTSVENLTMGALTWWLILMILTSLLLPGGSFLFTWPLLFSLLALGLIFLDKKERSDSIKRVAVFSIGAIPGVIILAPVIYLVFVGLTLGMSGAVMVLVVLLVGLLIPHLSFIATSYKWLLPGALALISIGLIGAGSLTSGFDRNHPRPDNIFYGLDADKAKAVWASADESPDSWTQQFFTAGSSRGVLPEYLPLSSRVFLQGPAPVAQLRAPQLELLSDETNNNVRKLRLRVTSPRQATVVSLTIDPDTQLTGSAVNGKVIKDQNGPQNPWALRYYDLPQQGIEVTLLAQPSAPINIRVVDQSYGLPAVEGITMQPRPENMMPSMLPYSDSTFVTKSYKF